MGWEVRTAEAIAAYYMVLASGTIGNATTLHSVTPMGAIRKMTWLMSSYLSIDFQIAQDLIMSEVDVIIQCRRTSKHGRRITDIVEIREGKIVPIFKFDEEQEVHVRFDKK